jgi:cyclopropane fatty-acyl-phospholipid synthase-like methyltransferase
VTALELVIEKLHAIKPQSHLDIGCGDGALLWHLKQRIPAMNVVGVDYDARSISLANVMSPDVRYVCQDIINEPLGELFDSGSMIEVFEHIPPDLAASFIAAARKMLKPGASLIVTVPHMNVPLVAKHYRHFTYKTLTECISPHLVVKDMFAFGHKTFASKLARQIARRSLFVESTHFNKFLLNQQMNAKSKTEAGFERIFAVLTAA